MADSAQERIKSLEQRLAQEPQSPLFARLADYYLQAGRAKDALRLCDDGLALYPFYSTAHLVKGKALIKLGMMAEAKHEYEVVHQLLPTSDSVARLFSSIDIGKPPEVHAARIVKKVAEVVTPRTSAPEVRIEERPVEEPQVVVAEEAPPQEPPATEEPFGPAEEVAAPEPTTAQPETFEPVEATATPEDAFGVIAPPPPVTEEETPSAADKLGLDTRPESMQTPPDFGFGSAAETPVEEDTFGAQPAEQPQPAFEATPAEAQEPSMYEVPETEPAQPAPEAAVPATPAAEEGPTGDWMEAFSQLQQPGAEETGTPATTPAEEENPFAMFGAEQPSAVTEGEPYEDFSARIRMELFGTEDTLTLDEYLGQSTPQEPPPEAPSDIGELAEKLKTSQRITPPVINFAEKAPRPPSEADTASAAGFVTPTLAEIYVKQGWYDDAIKAYRALSTNKPAEKEKYEQRIVEIEEMKKKQ